MHEGFVFIDGASKDDATFGFEEQFSGLSVFLPDLSGDERRIDNDHMERSEKLLRNVFRMVEIIEDIVRVLVKSFIKLDMEKNH